MSTFLETSMDKFLFDRMYEIIIPPTFNEFKEPIGSYFRSPSPQRWVTRIPKTIIAHKGKLFIGHGDYALNAGPCNVYSYDPLTKEWTNEAILPTEEISVIREIDGTLWIPCMDHNVSDAEAKIFKRHDDGTWETISIPFPAQHSFDICKWDNKLWVDIAQVSAAPNDRMAVACSDDGGATWERIDFYNFDGVSPPSIKVPGTNRLQSGFFVLNNNLYACHEFYDFYTNGGMFANNNGVFKYDVLLNKFVRFNDMLSLGGDNGSSTTYNLTFFTKISKGASRVTAVGVVWRSSVQCMLNGDQYQFFTMTNQNTFVKIEGTTNNQSLYQGLPGHTIYYKNETIISKGLLPALFGYTDGNHTKDDIIDDLTFVSTRMIISVCFSDGKLYALHVESKRHWPRNGPTPWRPTNFCVLASIISTSDMENWNIEYQTEFTSCTPTCLTILDGFAYMVIASTILSNNYRGGEIIRVKLGTG